MKRILLLAAAFLALASCGSKYQSVKGDPLDAKIYTLDNGLKVYMTVNKDEPRIQTYIAVHVGGKDDPADNTGLAQYLEHMMFKGSELFGTQDYESTTSSRSTAPKPIRPNGLQSTTRSTPSVMRRPRSPSPTNTTN